jgi:hypothetical protein
MINIFRKATNYFNDYSYEGETLNGKPHGFGKKTQSRRTSIC